MSSLSHHGIKGQRWGVRRFQNKDGTRTALGRKRQAAAQNVYKNQAANMLSEFKKNVKAKGVYGYEKTENEFLKHIENSALVERHNAYVNILNNENEEFAREALKNYYDLSEIHSEMNKMITDRRKTVHSKALDDDNNLLRSNIDSFYKEMTDDQRRKIDDLEELTSIQTMEKKEAPTRKVQHTSIGGTMYIEGNALILGDSSYLEHHGIRGQRWGVRRFQNRDGSLTNAGRKRLGYATKGVTQTVGKAFKAGVKAGGNAVKAVKAHHEKAEAKKKEKKKEKASKTRIGVMANKDLFTNEEIRKLNERFKLEDEMKMATLQKGVEIAKAVGTIAQNVGTMAKAYEDVTGQSLSPIKRKAAEEKAKQDAEDRKRKLAKEDAETKRAEDKEKRDIEDRERRIKLEDEDRVRKQAKEDADAQRAENAEKRAQAKEQRDSSMAVELQRKAKAAADEQEHKAVKAKADSRSTILDVLEKIDKIQDHDDDDDHNNPPGGGIDTWNDDDYLNFFKKTGIIHSDISNPSIIQNGVLFVDSSDGFAHHGVKGQRWGVRRFQNEDGSLTEKGRKHYEKKLAKAERKKVAADAARGYLERTHGFAVTSAAVLSGAAYAALMVASAANPATIALGTAVVAAMYGGAAHLTYSVNEAWEGRGSKKYERQANEYREKLKQSDMEDGMYHVENGTLFINAGEPYLEHHGVKGMKWGKHLMAGKSVDAEAGGGGGFAEDDEKLKAMAKKAGMSVSEYRTKMAGKLSGAASKVGEKVYDAAGGKYKKEARDLYRKAESIDRESENSKREQSSLRESSNRKREVAKQWDSEAKKAAAEARRANNLATQAGSTAKAYGERAKAKKEAAAKAKVPKMSRDPKTPHPFGSTGVREQDDKINSWADDINRNNKMTRSGWRRKVNYEQPKKEFEKAAQDIHNGKKNVTLSEGAAAYALAREQRAVRRRRHSATIGSGDEKKAKELNGIKREMEESGAIARRAQQSAKRTRDRINDSANMDSLYAKTAGRAASSQARAAKRKRAEAKEAQSKYENSLAGKYDKLKATRKEKTFSGTSPKAKKAVIAKKKATPTSYEKRINDAKNSVEKAARSNEAAYKHATEVYRQTGRDSDAYKQAIKRSQTTLWRSLDNQERLKQKRRRPADIGKKRAKHSDDTNAIYTEGTRLVVNSKWG